MRSEEILNDFYRWEHRGRGYRSHPYRVQIEPEFRPLQIGGRQALPDDGKRHTLVSRLLSGLLGRQPPPEETEEPPDIAEPPERAEPVEDLEEYHLVVPQDLRSEPSVTGQLLQSLNPSSPLSFEVVGNEAGVTVSLAGAAEDMQSVVPLAQGFFPDIEIVPAPQTLPDRWVANEATIFYVAELVLEREFLTPLASFRTFTPDPLSGLISTLSAVAEDELGVFQVLFAPASGAWYSEGLRGADFVAAAGFAAARDIQKLSRTKFASPLFAVVVRLAGLSRTDEAAIALLKRLLGPLKPFADPLGNELTPIIADLEETALDLLERSTHRQGMLLSLDELLGLVHLPNATVVSKALLRRAKKTNPAPAEVIRETGILLGENSHRGASVEVRLSVLTRLKHLHVVGASGTGKSTLLVQMILGDIAAGRGVGVLDPHGDLVDAVLARLPEDRGQDVVLLDPSDPDYVVGWNVLSARSEVERELLASDLVAVFRRLSTSWGDQMTAVLSHAILAFLHAPQGGTLADLRRFLVDSDYRKALLQTLSDPYLLSFWSQEFPMLLGRRPQAPILTRLDTFLRSAHVRDMVTAKNGLDFRSLVDSRAILSRAGEVVSIAVKGRGCALLAAFRDLS